MNDITSKMYNQLVKITNLTKYVDDDGCILFIGNTGHFVFSEILIMSDRIAPKLYRL
jgi:hypothetical protein